MGNVVGVGSRFWRSQFFPRFLRIEVYRGYQTPTMERNISTAARNGEPRWKSLTREDMKANTVVCTSHAGIKTVDVAEALVTQGYTDVASVQITNSNLTKVTLLSATQTDALLGHGFLSATAISLYALHSPNNYNSISLMSRSGSRIPLSAVLWLHLARSRETSAMVKFKPRQGLL